MIFKKVIDFINYSRENDICFLDGEMYLVNLEEFHQHSEKAIDRIVTAIDNNENILVFGHDDADGMTGTLILYDFLKQFYDKVDYYIPNRQIEHHGIGNNVIKYALNKQSKLLIAIDNGISSVEGVSTLKKEGIDTIILDHHLLPEATPNAYAIVNPKLFNAVNKHDLYFKNNMSLEMLAGVGVSYFFTYLLSQVLRQGFFKEDYLFWASIGTLADRVPLKSVNRLIIRQLLHDWDVSLGHPAIQFMLEKNRYMVHRYEKMDFLHKFINLFYHGREENGKQLCFSFLIANEKEEQNKYYENILLLQDNYNKELKKNIDYINEQVVQKIDEQKVFDSIQLLDEKLYLFSNNLKLSSIAFVDKDRQISYTMLGKVANTLLYTYKCPIIMITYKEDNTAACEARSLKGFNWLECFNSMPDMFENYGGHERAAGFLIKTNKLDLFFEKYHEYIENLDSTDVQVYDENIICFDYYDTIWEELIELYELLLPFGEANKLPVFKVLNPVIADLNSDLIVNIDTIPLSSDSETLDDICVKYTKDGMNLVIV